MRLDVIKPDADQHLKLSTLRTTLGGCIVALPIFKLGRSIGRWVIGWFQAIGNYFTLTTSTVNSLSGSEITVADRQEDRSSSIEVDLQSEFSYASSSSSAIEVDRQSASVNVDAKSQVMQSGQFANLSDLEGLFKTRESLEQYLNLLPQ